MAQALKARRSSYANDFLDPEWYTETFLHIRTKEKRVVPFILNPVQRSFLTELRATRMAADGLRGCREIVLKARQHGFTTLILALFYHDTVTNEGVNTVIVPHRREDAEEMLQTVQIFYDGTPARYKPVIRYNSTYRMSFPKLRSQITIATGGSRSVGRSRTIHNLLVTELPFWPDAGENLAPLLDTVPVNGNVVIESTPGGVGDEFYRRAQQAEKGLGQFRLHRYAWWCNKDYRIALDPGESLEPYTDDEIELIGSAGLVPEQIKWRREMLADRGARKFAQEYECDFSRSGRMVFDATALKRYQRKSEGKEPISVAQLQQLIPWRRLEKTHLSVGLSPEGWRVWEAPQQGVEYIVGADVAEGRRGGDYDAAPVIRRDTGRQVGMLYGQWSPAVYAGKLFVWAHFWNKAHLGVERNNHGHAVLLKLREWDYPRLVWWEGYPGWLTSGKTKPLIIDRLEEALRKEWLPEFLDPLLVEELFAFVHHDDGTMGATTGAHDDTVMGLAIAWFLRQVVSRVKTGDGADVGVREIS